MNTESVMSITALCPAAVRGGYAVQPSLLALRTGSPVQVGGQSQVTTQQD